MVKSIFFKAQEVPREVAAYVLENNQAFNWSLQASQEDLANSLTRLMVLQEEEEILAYCGWHQILDEATINYIWVAPTYRGQGLGRYLLQEVLQQMIHEAVIQVNLEVRESNHRAIRLYEGLGFREMGKRPLYYQDPAEDGIVWQYRVEKGESEDGIINSSH